MTVLAWIVLGLVAGLIAKAIYPGRQGGGVMATLVLGMLGAVVGGWAGRLLTGMPAAGAPLSFASVAWSVVGALVVLFFHGIASRKRPTGKV